MTITAKKYFFKVFVPEKHYQRMLIPNAFVKWTRLQERIPEGVILRNSSGRVWCVKTRLIGDKFYLDEGWKAFRQENSVGKADFMVFKYNGSNEFKVIILELCTQCEKTVIKEEEEEEEEEEIEDKAAAQDKKEEENSKDCDEEEEIEKTEEEEHEEVEDEDEDEDYDDDDGDHDDNSDDEYTDMEEESNEEQNAGYMRSESHPRACKREIASSSNPKSEDPLPDDYDFDPEMYIQPDNPFFEARLYKRRPNELHVPANVTKDWSLTFPEKITLLCCQCFQRQNISRIKLRDYHLSLAQRTPICAKYLEVGKVTKWQDGRVCIKGWGSFCRSNKIKENDVCICEIISGEDQIIRTFRVHVVGARNG